MSRLKSSSSSKSDREMVVSVQEVLAIASVERSERSKMDISPKRDPDLSLGDDEESVAGLAFFENVLPNGVFLLAADLSDAGQLAVVQVLEDRGLLQQLKIHAVKLRGTRRGHK